MKMSFNLKFWRRGDANKKNTSRNVEKENKKISPEEEEKKSKLKSEIRESNTLIINLLINRKQTVAEN